MSKRDAEAARDAKRQAEWKDTLAAIRGGLPIERNRPVPRNLGEKTFEVKARDREILLALCDRQEWKCFWCGCPMTAGDPAAPTYRTLEHVVGKATGLAVVNHLSNLRAACRHCNSTRAELQAVKSQMAKVERIQLQLDAARKTIARHKITVAGRCYWCKFRFYLLEWWHKRKRDTL